MDDDDNHIKKDTQMVRVGESQRDRPQQQNEWFTVMTPRCGELQPASVFVFSRVSCSSGLWVGRGTEQSRDFYVQ